MSNLDPTVENGNRTPITSKKVSQRKYSELGDELERTSQPEQYAGDCYRRPGERNSVPKNNTNVPAKKALIIGTTSSTMAGRPAPKKPASETSVQQREHDCGCRRKGLARQHAHSDPDARITAGLPEEGPERTVPEQRIRHICQGVRDARLSKGRRRVEKYVAGDESGGVEWVQVAAGSRSCESGAKTKATTSSATMKPGMIRSARAR